MNTQYKHSQPGYLMIVISVIFLAVTAYVYVYDSQQAGWILGAIGLLILVFGYKLTVEISGGYFRFWFGPGIFRKKIAFDRIAYCEPCKGIILGWGIHVGPGGWLYNVSGMKAVTVVLKSGKKMHIGTDEPQHLIEAINSAIFGRGMDKADPMWSEVKANYLKSVEQALSAARHPRSFEILADVGHHLDRRFAELGPQERTWENFQKIITEMGPPSEYAELVGIDEKTTKSPLSGRFVTILVLVLAGLAAAMIFLPKRLKPNDVGVTKQANVMSTNRPEVAAAIESAKSWLKLVDDGEYEQSWAQAAEYFRNNVSEQKWPGMVEPVRKPLGKVLSREVMTSTYMTELPGAPDGQYVIIQFKTSFENKQSAIETVTPMLDPDGQWRVSGYYIK